MDGTLHTRANISAKNIAGTNLRLRMFCFEMSLKRRQLRQNYCPNVFTIPIMAMGCRQCLPFSVVQLKGKHCQKTIAVNPIAVAGCILHRACLLFSSIYRIMSSLNKTICKKKTLWNLYEKNIKECADQRCIMKKRSCQNVLLCSLRLPRQL